MDYPAWPRVNTHAELAYLRAGSEPPWERVRHGGVDVTDQPELWSPYERERRDEFLERVAGYREAGLL